MTAPARHTRNAPGRAATQVLSNNKLAIAGRQVTLTPGYVSDSYGEAAASHNKSLSIHRWSPWIAGFSGEFARNAITQYLPFPRRGAGRAGPDENSLVLDPFAGVGTTLVEANRLGIDAVGFEINPFAALVCKVKLGSGDISLGVLSDSIDEYGDFIARAEESPDLVPLSSPPPGFKSRIPFLSPAVERKVLLTLDYMNGLEPRIGEIFNVALSSVIVEFSNYSYEPSLGSRPAAGKSLVHDADVGKILLAKLGQILSDIKEFQSELSSGNLTPEWRLHERSFFDSDGIIRPGSVDLVVTSPPYMNNYHYVRNSRPQLFWSGLVESTVELKRLETDNFGKYWQTVRGGPPIQLEPKLPNLEETIGVMRSVNESKGVYGGTGWANYVATYMNDLDRLCNRLGRLLRPGGSAVIVVGNSMIQGKEIKVEEYLCRIGELQGLSVLGVSKLRDRVGSSIVNSGSRLQTKRKSTLYDAAVVLRRF